MLIDMGDKSTAGREKSRSTLGMCEEQQGGPSSSSRVNNGKAVWSGKLGRRRLSRVL